MAAKRKAAAQKAKAAKARAKRRAKSPKGKLLARHAKLTRLILNRYGRTALQKSKLPEGIANW